MTPEELNRTIEFIVEHQAKISANLEQISEDFQRAHEERAEFEKSAHLLMTQLAANDRRIADSCSIQSSRLDRAEAEDRAAQKRHIELLQEMLNGFDRILDRLPGK